LEPEDRSYIAAKFRELVEKGQPPEWFIPFLVDVHRIVIELHTINVTLMALAKRDIERKRTASGDDTCPTT